MEEEKQTVDSNKLKASFPEKAIQKVMEWYAKILWKKKFKKAFIFYNYQIYRTIWRVLTIFNNRYNN